MKKNLWPHFMHLGEFEEVVSALMLHFNGASTGIPGKIDALLLGSPPQIEVRYSLNGKPIIQASELSNSDLEKLVAACHVILTPEIRWVTVAMEIDAKVTGVFVHPDLRIRALPDQEKWISKTNFVPPVVRNMFPISQNPNPILIDLSYTGTKTPGLANDMRLHRAAREAEGLAMIGIWPMPRPTRRISNCSFTLVWDEDIGDLRSARLMKGFAHPDLNWAGSTAPPCLSENEPFPTIEHERFAQGPLDLEPADIVWIHPHMDKIIDRARTLSKETRRSLGRALHWLELGMESQSPTIQVVACASAIEALLPKTDVDKCKECNQDRFKVSSRFKDFVRKYATTPSSVNFLDLVYQARSRLVHGSHLYEIDEPPFSFGARSRRESMTARWVARAAIINWLWEGTSETPAKPA